LSESDFYGALEDYALGLVKAVIEALIEQRFLIKSTGQYPTIEVSAD
jgi:hypothetical protein